MQDTLNLAGKWRIALDEKNTGIRERWWKRSLKDSIQLPGTTDEAGYGELSGEACADRLSRVRRWIGPAWYQRTVTIPKTWSGKKIFLFLERTKDSQVWVDGAWAGSDDSLSTPHEFDLSKWLTPGKHVITILIDNAKLPPVGPCHQVDERTQTNWNGIVGRIELRMTETIWIRNLQAHPNPGKRVIDVVVEVVNETAWSGAGDFVLRAQVVGHKKQFDIPPVEAGKLLNHGTLTLKMSIPIPAEVPCWEEFDPTLLRITADVAAMPVATWVRDSRSVMCGLRSFTTSRGQFLINGRPTMLRGKLDCALFPLTGYAPMDKAEWKRLLSISKHYGINHYRFHSWCPPEAAFEAADELGIYLLAELPNKREITAPEDKNYKPPKEAYETLVELEGDAGVPAVRTAYLLREGERILRYYGNHPSFVMFTLGNELGGDETVMKGMCDHFRSLDSRHLYAMGSGHFHWAPKLHAGDEFWVTRTTGNGLHLRGASFEASGHIDHVPPSTTVDYSASLQAVPIPVVAHEIAEFEMYPDYREIRKYTGVLRARNFEIFRERLKAAGMLDQAHDFFKASGALSVICHREDIESELRTPGLGGFHLLDIQDFSGQGTALVGILDVFMDSKGLITPEAWRQFCCETVPLFWMQKYTWTSDEEFRGRIRVAHYGPKDLENQSVSWVLRAGQETVGQGTILAKRIRTGAVNEIDLVHAPLNSIGKAQKLKLTISLDKTPYRNSYDLWVYPPKVDTVKPAGVTITRKLTAAVQKKLMDGGSVLLMPERGSLKRTVAMAFQTGFWSPMFRMGARKAPDGKEVPGTQGILCDPKHPLFADFPTEFHSNWQWWQLCKHCDPMILDGAPAGFRPVVQVIDGIDRNHKLGLILEARAGRGRLLICTIDLPGLQKHPEARQLLASIQHYMASDDFQPRQELSGDMIGKILG
jgi:hypothetical protein